MLTSYVSNVLLTRKCLSNPDVVLCLVHGCLPLAILLRNLTLKSIPVKSDTKTLRLFSPVEDYLVYSFDLQDSRGSD